MSRTKRARDTIFVGNKQDTLNALKAILMKKTQWCEYMDKVLDVITLNATNAEVQQHQHNQSRNLEAYPFRICDISLPQCQTGYVYILMSLQQRKYVYIGQTKCLRRRIQEHNSGYGSSSTESPLLRPFAILAYICGFDNNRELREHAERKWKQIRNSMVRSGVDDPRLIARAGQQVINEIDCNRFQNVETTDLALVCLFRE